LLSSDAEFRRTAEETRERHASSPGAGAGNSLLLVAIDTAHPNLIISAIPRHALTFLFVVFRCMDIYGLSQIGPGHYSEVYSCKGLDGQPIQLSRISVCADTQPRRHAAAQPCDRTDTQSRSRAAAQTRSRAAVQPRRHAAARPHKYTAAHPCDRADTQPCDRADTQSLRHAAAQTRRRADAQTRRHAAAQTRSDTQPSRGCRASRVAMSSSTRVTAALASAAKSKNRAFIQRDAGPYPAGNGRCVETHRQQQPVTNSGCDLPQLPQHHLSQLNHSRMPVRALVAPRSALSGIAASSAAADGMARRTPKPGSTSRTRTRGHRRRTGGKWRWRGGGRLWSRGRVWREGRAAGPPCLVCRAPLPLVPTCRCRWPRAQLCPESRGPWPPVQCAHKPSARCGQAESSDC
jgi:hypothetical protein